MSLDLQEKYLKVQGVAEAVSLRLTALLALVDLITELTLHESLLELIKLIA